MNVNVEHFGWMLVIVTGLLCGLRVWKIAHRPVPPCMHKLDMKAVTYLAKTQCTNGEYTEFLFLCQKCGYTDVRRLNGRQVALSDLLDQFVNGKDTP